MPVHTDPEGLPPGVKMFVQGGTGDVLISAASFGEEAPLRYLLIRTQDGPGKIGRMAPGDPRAAVTSERPPELIIDVGSREGADAWIEALKTIRKALPKTPAGPPLGTPVRITVEELRDAAPGALAPYVEIDLSGYEVIGWREGPYWEVLDRAMSALLDNPDGAPEALDLIVPGGTRVELYRKNGTPPPKRRRPRAQGGAGG